MKRFWVFVIICIVALGMGFTVFRFMTKEEILYVNQSVYELNSGENFVLDIVKKDLKAGTEVYIDVQNPNIVARTEEHDSYNFKALSGGSTTIIVTSNLKSFLPVSIQVTVGDGNVATPFLIKNQEQLEKIGKTTNMENGESLTYPLSSCYKLISDIALVGDWTPIASTSTDGFTGHFDFNGKTISNLTISSTTGSAGLFAKVGTNGYIKGAKLKDVVISSSSSNVGSIAGENFGTIENGEIRNATITNSISGANVGGVAGLNSGLVTKTQIFASTINSNGSNSVVGGLVGSSNLQSISTTTMVTRSSAECTLNTESALAVGGLVGSINGSSIENCYAGNIDTHCVITAGQSSYVGGIVGICRYVTVSSRNIRANVADTYSVMEYSSTTSDRVGAIIGFYINDPYDDENYNRVYGNYYKLAEGPSSSTIKGIAAPSEAEIGEELYKELGVFGKTREELQTKSTYKSFSGLDWQFNEGVWTMAVNELPKLSFIVNYVSSRIQYYTSPSEINSGNFVSTLTNADPQTTYKITQDIYLDDSNYYPFDFNGRLTCTKLDESGEPKYKIYLTLQEKNVKDGCAAVFKTLGPNANLTNIAVFITISNITSANHIAALAAYNNGVVENCYAENSITTDFTGGTLYLAGLIAENNGKISKSNSSVQITYSKSTSLLYVGGICGFNTNAIQNSSNTGVLSITGKSTTGYVGGITGATTSEVTTCANKGKITGQEEASGMAYGGIAGYIGSQSDAAVKYSSNYADVSGSNVGGIVGISLNSVEYCYVSSVLLRGKYVGGLAYNIKYGYMKNSMTERTIIDATQVGCGVVYQIDVTEQHTAYCQNIFSSCDFAGSGENYYESASNIRGYARWWDVFISAIDMHAFDNCIYVKKNDSIKRSYFDETIDMLDHRSGRVDIPVTDDQATGNDGAYQIFKDNNFASSIWIYNTETIGSYIHLRDIAK